ncbi:MAG: PASTA domain-containing protein [Actinobacteria bacterium]|nr:PASTA domain-containing protein [Actinomycetota bacterium]
MSNEFKNDAVHQALGLIKREIEDTIHQLRLQLENCETRLKKCLEERAKLAKANMELEEENNRLRVRIEELKSKQPLLDAEALLSSFATALQTMQKTLNEAGGPVSYGLRDLKTDLKVGVVVDEKGLLRFRLPGLKEVISPGNLSTLNFSVVAAAPSIGKMDIVSVPRIVGLQLDEARRRVEQAGFKIGKVEEQTSYLISGTVLEQMPPGGSVAKMGRAIDIVISKKVTTRVPLLINLLENEAEKLLQISHLRLGRVTTCSSDVPDGTVLEQSIEANTKVPINTQVSLVISEGKEVKVPNLIDLSKRKAAQELRKKGLQPGKVEYAPSSKPRGLVLAQKPDSGKIMGLSGKVDLVLSEGPKKKSTKKK